MMTGEERFELYKKAIEKWGELPQINMVYEECGELLTALARFLRGRASNPEVITEIADVQIMMEQMAVLFGQFEVAAEKERKLERLKERLEK